MFALMTAEEIKHKFELLVKEHQAIDDSLDGLKDAELVEAEGLELIADYCRAEGYEWDYKHPELDEMGEEQFSTSHYVDSMALEHPDVFELLWLYNSSLWPNFFENGPDGFKDSLREMLDKPGEWYYDEF